LPIHLFSFFLSPRSLISSFPFFFEIIDSLRGTLFLPDSAQLMKGGCWSFNRFHFSLLPFLNFCAAMFLLRFHFFLPTPLLVYCAAPPLLVFFLASRCYLLFWTPPPFQRRRSRHLPSFASVSLSAHPLFSMLFCKI